MHDYSSDPNDSHDILDAYRAELTHVLSGRRDVRTVLEDVIRDPHSLSSRDLFNDLQLLEHLGNRLVRGLSEVLETDLADARACAALVGGA